MKRLLLLFGLMLVSIAFVCAQSHIISATYGSSYVKKHPIAGGSGTYINLSSGPGGSAFGPSTTDSHLYLAWYSGQVWRYNLDGTGGVLWFNYNANVSGNYTGYIVNTAINETHLFVGNEYNNKIVKIELANPSNFQEIDFTGYGTGTYSRISAFVTVNDSYIFCGGGSNNYSTNIGRSDLDGSNKMKLLDANAAVQGLACDDTYLYWRDYAGNIGRCYHDGTNVNKSWITGLNSGYIWGILVDNNYIYAMHSYNNLYRYNLDGTNPTDLGSGYLNRGLCFATFSNNYTWDGSTSTDWSTASNWDLNEVPTAYDNVTIPSVTNDPVINWNGGECNNLTIESEASLTVDAGALITNGTVTNNGSFSINVFHSAGVWELIGIPVANQMAEIFEGSYLQTYTEATDTWNEIIETTTPLVPGTGYALYENFGKIGLMTYSGTPNTGDFSASYSYSPTGNPLHYGFNLMGNPYPSYIDWGTLNSTYGAVYHYDGSSYSSWNGTGSGSQYINPAEGFLIAPGATGTLELTDDCRVLNQPLKTVKAKNNTIILDASNENYTDPLYITFNDAATENFDLPYDAWKILTEEPNVPQLFTINNSQHYSIDQRPECEEVKLGFTCKNSGTYTIAQQQNSFGGVLFLEDLLTGTIHDLSKSNYIFDWSTSEDNHRFNLHFSPLGIDNPLASELTVYTAGNILYVNTDREQTLNVQVSDLLGQQVMAKSISSLSNEIPLNIETGIYLVSISNGIHASTHKVFVK
ncbi:MAG: T9SS type A sorting domain-containing protein [Bacteroidales bacterium]|nr:T9SS type A sorting domain-containing protein [Bacteroidales bacterium]MCF8403158.1 T9SS type A sorting domain-containing protein [Bacteroidales bacterium]